MAAQNTAEIWRIKLAARALAEQMDTAPKDRTYKLQIGVMLAPLIDLNPQEVKTALNKYVQALANFPEEATASMSMEFVVDDPIETAIVKAAQEALSKKAELRANVQQKEIVKSASDADVKAEAADAEPKKP